MRVGMGHGIESMSQRCLHDYFGQTPERSGDEHAKPSSTNGAPMGKFVDLFAGLGAVSTGAMNAGYHVVLAVDSCEQVLKVHAKNHPRVKHLCVTLPPSDPLPVPTNDERWHCHGSPPCTLVSRANRRTRTPEEAEQGLELVRYERFTRTRPNCP